MISTAESILTGLSCSKHLEPISDPADGHDPSPFRAKLAAQPRDVGVDRPQPIRIRASGRADSILQVAPPQGDSAHAHQLAQQSQLFRGQSNGMAADGGLVTVEIQLNPAPLKDPAWP